MTLHPYPGLTAEVAACGCARPQLWSCSQTCHILGVAVEAFEQGSRLEQLFSLAEVGQLLTPPIFAIFPGSPRGQLGSLSSRFPLPKTMGQAVPSWGRQHFLCFLALCIIKSALPENETVSQD